MANSMSQYRQNGVDYIIDDPTVAPVFVESAAYAAGQYVKHQGNLYRFTTNHAAGAWNASEVTQAILGNEVSDLKSALTSVNRYYYAERGVWNGTAVVPSNNVAHVIDIPLNKYRKFKFHYPSTIRYYSLWKKVNGSWSSVSGITNDEYEADDTVQNFIVQFVNKTSSSTNITDEELSNIYLSCVDADIEGLDTRLNNLEDQVDLIPTIIEPRDTSFFEGVNYFDPNTADVYTDRIYDGTKIVSASPAFSVAFHVRPNTTYYFYVPDANRTFIGESADNNFPLDKRLTALLTSGNYPVTFTTGSTANYVFAFCYSGPYDYATKKNQIVLNIGEYYGDTTPFIPSEYLDADVANVLDGANILIFGDSITDTCNITINSSNQTAAYAWRNPSNSYTKDGTLIQYSMWPKILKLSEPCGEIRNYALAGASYLTHDRESGYERQNVQYQIDVALNDRLNPNNVFDVDDYKPQIIIFALGTNDGVPLDTFESAMAATVYESDGVTINVNATLAALDDTKTIASARKAFLRVKQAFPAAQIYCVLPIQRADQDNNWGTLRTYLRQMAERCGCIVIDGTASSGITREFNVFNGVGTYLKDGLHPNELGQNFMARLIISELKNNYCPFGAGYNQL